MSQISDPAGAGRWLQDPVHRAYLLENARRQLRFFDGTLRGDGGFDVLDRDGTPLPRAGQELHYTTRMVHSYVLGRAIGHRGADRMIDAGMAFLLTRHRDAQHGGYLWSVDETGVHDGLKLAYGHVFVLLAASSAKLAGHPDADRLMADVAEVLDRHYWDEAAGLHREEFARDWQPISTYRGMNANMHSVEAMLAAFEVTGDAHWLERAGRVLEVFTDRMPRANGWRVPEHYTEDWQVDPEYAGDPMFRPAGTTPGHSLELARLLLQHWDLAGRPAGDAPERARRLAETALIDAWRVDGGLAYTLKPGGEVDIGDRYWWPVTEGICALASLLKLEGRDGDETWYRRLWRFADMRFVDHDRGGWYPELDDDGAPEGRQFTGKPDIYHALQAELYPLAPGLSRQVEGLGTL
ncbi:mannose-6-phosphate isomerase [Sagittula sp. P11]|uniref:AGE family epimerase/isomerase n=1 Tax=Sagittula sp. P11 TaxID=2009329 RepID=UPI000C2D2955|nr:AGE family epimerase/isomerase [Sagittula sp. P11]AUC54522.1 mannose-6-phosphate isomerase [Sagittula sp. P11]